MSRISLLPGNWSAKSFTALKAWSSWPQSIHALQVLEQVLLGFDDDVFAGVEMREGEVGLNSSRIYPENLAAERDSVVVESLFLVEIRGFLVGLDRRPRFVGLEVEVTDPIVNREVRGGIVPRLEFPDGLLIDIDGPLPLFFLLKFPGRFLQLLEVHPTGEWRVQPLENLTLRRYEWP